ncbi:MAG: ATP-binding cassette domain-containing protein [Bdellovibrionaceae bacterium]|nr:ATP-binding cassette domain-containing protein [Pseudobdellovibrionaceae bacterium]
MSRQMLKPQYLQDGDGRVETGFSRSVLETLRHAYRPFWGKMVLIFLAGFCGRIILLANANVIGVWVDTFCDPKATLHCRPIPNFFLNFTATEFLQLLSGMVLFGFILTVFFRVVFSRMSALAISQLYDEVTYRTSRFPMSFFDKTPAGRIITRFASDYGNVFRLFGGPLAEFVSIIFDLLVMTLLITVASPYYLIFVGIIALLNYLVYRLNRKSLRAARRDLSASRSPSIAHFAETTQGASTIRSFLRQDSFISRFQRLDSYFLNQKLKTTGRLVSFSFQMGSLSALLLLLMGASSLYLVQAGKVSVGSIGVAFTFIALSGNTIQMFFEWLTQLEEAMIGVERLDQYLRKDLEPGNLLPVTAQFDTGHPRYDKSYEENLASPRLSANKNASVQVDGVWFKYRDDLPWVLKNIQFEVRAGERLGIVGRTGSGKSSLIQALFYLYPLHSGKISIDRQSPKIQPGSEGIDLNIYRRSMAFISQDPVLFQGTLKYNLDINGNKSDNELLAVLDQVGLREWVLQQPAKLDMKIEERGKNLSLGERQLLCMARCLLQEAPIIIMDEATSSVDPQSEEILVRATEEFFASRTQIIIAHRLSTLEKCDRILWLHNGQIRSLGPTKEILPQFKATNLSPN